MLTARGAALLVGAVVLWAVGRLLGVPELYVVAVTSAALVAAGALAVRLASAQVSVRRQVSEVRLLHGATAEVTLDLRNDARLGAPLLMVEDAVDWALGEPPRFLVAGIRPGATRRLSYRLHGGARGRYNVGPLRVRVRDPFGASQLTRRYASTDELLVYPRVEQLPAGLARGNHRGSRSSDQRRLLNAGDEFHTMRDYVQGDDLRLVHWPSTARRNKLVIRQHELPLSSEATIFCDTRAEASRGVGPEATVEVAISAAASVVWHLADHGYHLQLTHPDDGGRPVEGWSAMLDTLAEVEPSRAHGLGASLIGMRGGGGEGLLVCVVLPPQGDGPVAEHPDTRALVLAGRGWGARVAVVVHSARYDAARAEELAALLRAARWRACTLPAGVPLADRWPDVLSPHARAAAAATRDA